MRPAKIFLKPSTEGLIVRQPDRDYQPLPAEGAFVPNNAYWRKRKDAGEVVEATPPTRKPSRKSRAAKDSPAPNTEASES
jgi:hypothetical protein